MRAAAAFRALHAQLHLLLLPNVWDAGSALVMVAAGAQAVATSSAGLAWSCGYPDGGTLPRETLLEAVRAICRVCDDVPVSVDIENGFSDAPQAVRDLVARLRELGVAGINLEDGTDTPDALAAKIEAVARDGDMFINARADAFLRGLVAPERAVAESIARARRYADAGASGIFVPGARDASQIREMAAATALPFSILAEPDLPAHEDLFALGVRRLSAGSATAKVAYGAANAAARDFLHGGECGGLFAGPTIGYDAMNALAARHS